MPEWTLDFLSALGTNVLAAILFEWLRAYVPIVPAPLEGYISDSARHTASASKQYRNTKPFPMTSSYASVDYAEDTRAQNRRKVGTFFLHVSFYLSTLLVLYICLFVPALLKPWFPQNSVQSLQDIGIIGTFLPETMTLEYISQPAVIMIVGLVYLLVLALVTKVTRPIGRILDRWVEMRIRQWLGLQTAVFVIVAFLLSSLSVWLCYDLPFWQALLAPVMAVILLGVVLLDKPSS